MAYLSRRRKMDKLRLANIIRIANKLGWIFPEDYNKDKLLMQLEDVEKCMIAMEDDIEYNRFIQWGKEIKDGTEVKTK